MKRRLFLKGAGGAALAAPFLSTISPLEEAGAQGAGEAPKRLVIFYTNNGVLTNRWFPSVEDGEITADTLAGGTLAGLAPFAPKLLFPRGLGMFPTGNVTVNGSTYYDPHDQAMGSKLTCAPIDSSQDSHWALSHSLDHEVAKMVNPGGAGPLVLSVGSVFANVKGIVSYSASAEPYSPESKPSNVYSSLTGVFVGDNGGTTEADYRVKRGESIIDLVSDDLQTMKRGGLGQDDERRVDDWLQLLRETEQQVVSAACNAETAAALGITDAAVKEASAGGFGDYGPAFTLGGDMMIKLIALTMMCDQNRSIIMQWPGYVNFDWDGIHHDYDHHGLSHRNGSNQVAGECVPGVIDMLAEIDDWYAGRYVKLVSLIDSVTEGEGTMLDNSAVIWLPEVGDGNTHNVDNLPIVVAGSAGGYLKQGVSINLTDTELTAGQSEASCVDGTEIGFDTGSPWGIGKVPLNKFYTTLLNAVGATDENGDAVETFGMVDSNDIEAGITDPGELDALKA